MRKLEKIERYNFNGCLNLSHLLLPKLEIIEYGVFSRCLNLKELDLPALKKCSGF